MPTGVTRTRLAAATAACLALLASVPSARLAPPPGVDVTRLGPQVGDRVPDFRLSDQHGRRWTRDSIMGPKGAMLVFYRSADW
jgi:hypothetical protein